MEIDWKPSTFESHTKNTSLKISGYVCSNCGRFEHIKSRYCRDCGGRYAGSVKNKMSIGDYEFGGF